MFRTVKCAVIRSKNIARSLHSSKILLNGFSYKAFATLKKYSEYEDTHTGKKQNVADFYAGKSILITGGTGFLGKVLIERLLNNCSEIENIYVLIREKQGLCIDSRLKKTLEVPLFENLKNKNPDALNKIVAIAGDITKHNLGIKEADEQTLIENVSVVIHSAATVRFNEKFKNILTINLEGTRKILELSKKIKNLDTFVHVSTAFSNSDKIVIEEKLYPPFKEIEDVVSFVKQHGDNEAKIRKFLGYNPNTYTLSKSLCENLVSQEKGDMKTIIVRPAIVAPAYKSSPGWLDTWVATTALYTDMSRGLTRVAYGDSRVVCDLIPVDFVCNFIIIAAAKGAKKNKLEVYNSCSSSTNPITWKHGADVFLEESLKQPRYPGEFKATKLIQSRSPLVVNTLTFMVQTAPAAIADVLLRIRGKNPRHLENQRRPVSLRNILRPFCITSWLIKSDNSQKLISSLSEEDKVRFPCDPKTINWEEYLKIYYHGVRKYMLKR